TFKLMRPAIWSNIGILKCRPEFRMVLNFPKRSNTADVCCFTVNIPEKRIIRENRIIRGIKIYAVIKEYFIRTLKILIIILHLFSCSFNQAAYEICIFLFGGAIFYLHDFWPTKIYRRQ